MPLTLNLAGLSSVATMAKPEASRKDRKRITSNSRDRRRAALLRDKAQEIGRHIDDWITSEVPNLDVLTRVGVDAVDAIEHLARRFGPYHLHVLSFAVGESSLRRLRHLKDAGQLLSLNFVVDAFMVSCAKSAPAAMLRQCADKVVTAQVHAKAYTLTNEGDGEQFTITGSANLTANPRVEILHISREQHIAHFYRSAIFELAADSEARQ